MSDVNDKRWAMNDERWTMNDERGLEMDIECMCRMDWLSMIEYSTSSKKKI